MSILYLKSIHIIFVVTWFAGLFYIVRLFIYHSEAEQKSQTEKEILQGQYKIMEKRLWYGITWPSLILTWIFGFLLAYSMFGFNFPDWLLLKFLFVLGLTAYHLYCHKIFRDFQKDKISWSSEKLRMWNEVATLFLVAIVFLVVLKGFADLAYGLAGFLLLATLLFLAVKLYKRFRNKK